MLLRIEKIFKSRCNFLSEHKKGPFFVRRPVGKVYYKTCLASVLEDQKLLEVNSLPKKYWLFGFI